LVNSDGIFKDENQVFVLPFSAATTKSLETRRQQVCDLVQQSNSTRLRQVALTLGKHEARLRLKAFVLATTSSPNSRLLEGVDEGAETAVSGAQPLPFAFVFTGQGAQYAGMAKELLEGNTAFLANIRDLDQVLQALPSQHAPDWSLEQSILDPPATSKINEVTRSQPICTAVQIALIDLLRSFGINPSVVIGHSSGEIAAAYSAGLLTTSQAILVAYFRGYSVGQMQSRGAMMAAGITAEAANALIENQGLREICVACLNAPESVTFSGSAKDIQTVQVELEKENKFTRRLETGGRAYHSHMMTEVGDLYEQLISPCFSKSTGPTNVSLKPRMYSTVGNSPENLGIVNNKTNMAAYFRQNLELSVQFCSVLTGLLRSGTYHLVEIGPHSALKGPVQQITKAVNHDKTSIPYSPTLVRKEDANICLKRLAGNLFSYGHRLEWHVVNDANDTLKLPRTSLLGQTLPPYPWDYSRELQWHEPRASVDIRNRKHLRHELLGTQTAAGNGIDWNWRNIVRLSEMPWLVDHKLEAQVVLPGSAYLALAIEALSQVQDLKGRLIEGEAMSFEGQSINISTPFLLRDDDGIEAEHTELHTTLSRRQISAANSSVDWHEFSVSSWASGITTLHCTGSIRVIESASTSTTVGSVLNLEESKEAWSMSRWYNKSREEGLNFGPHFQSLTSLHTDGSRIHADAIATTQLEPPLVREAGTFYALHPITLDACFQAAIMGGTAGNINTLRAFVPVFISEIRTHVPGVGSNIGSEDCKVHTRIENTGFSTRRVDCTLRQTDGTPIVDMTNVRLQLYTGKAQVQHPRSLFLQRQPCLRIHWRPNILRLHAGSKSALREYIHSFAARQSADMKDIESQIVFGALLELAGHKNPRMRVLELGHGCECIAKRCQLILDKGTAFPKYQSWHNGRFEEDGKRFIEEAEISGPFDVVSIPLHETSQGIWNHAPDQLISLVSDQGIVITRKTEKAISSLKTAGFATLELPSRTILGIRSQETTALKGKEVLLVVPNKPSRTIRALASSLGIYFKGETAVEKVSSTSLSNLDGLELSGHVMCVSLLETEGELLATISPKDMDRLRKITDKVTELIWLTGASMLDAPNPDLTLSSGLARALMLEQPSLRYTVLDIGDADIGNRPENISSTCDNVSRALIPRYSTDDTEFVQRGHSLYVSRFVPDFELNSLFRQRFHSQQETLETDMLGNIAPAKLSIGQVGMTDTLHFQQIFEPLTKPPIGFVDVDLRAVSLNAKDIYAMSGRVETRLATTALDFSGVISAIGPDVTHLKPGDRVVGLAPNHFGTTERVPVAAVHKLLPAEEFTIVPTLLTVYSTALFALRDRANLRAGETILIHAGAGAFGLAAIAMAQRIGATIYTTVGSQAKRDYLVTNRCTRTEHLQLARRVICKGAQGSDGWPWC
jgi:acyl transferase domain-containing protein